MIVCVCNALREREIFRKVEDGAVTADEVFASLDCEPRCGTCVGEITTLIGETCTAACRPASPEAVAA